MATAVVVAGWQEPLTQRWEESQEGVQPEVFTGSQASVAVLQTWVASQAGRQAPGLATQTAAAVSQTEPCGHCGSAVHAPRLEVRQAASAARKRTEEVARMIMIRRPRSGRPRRRAARPRR